MVDGWSLFNHKAPPSGKSDKKTEEKTRGLSWPMKLRIKPAKATPKSVVKMNGVSIDTPPFGVPPSGGHCGANHVGPPEGGTPNRLPCSCRDYGVFSKTTNARSRSAPVLGRSNFRRPRAHGITESLQLADMAVAGDGHTPYFENTP
jgi:hypothetical protein